MTPPADRAAEQAGDWIPDCLDTVRARHPLVLEGYADNGEPAEAMCIDEVAARFGRSDATLRQLRHRTWFDADGEPVDDFGDAAFVNTASGMRVPLREVPRLVGCEVGAAGITALGIGTDAGPALPAILPSAPPGAASSYYTTNKRRPALIPGKTRQWMLDNLPGIPGAFKPRGRSGREGRDWVISHDDWMKWQSAQDAAACRASAPGRAPDADARTIAETTLAKAGLRPTKGGR